MLFRSIFVSTVAIFMFSATTRASCAQRSGVRVQGPWIYTKQIDRATEMAQDMATTMATGEDNVWLVLVCSQDGQMTVSFMHIEEFSYPIDGRVNVSLRMDTHPKLTMPALRVNSKQISIDPGSSHDLLPLLADSGRSSVTIPDSLGNIHEYTFILQPNDLALGNIRAKCLT